MHKDCFSSRCTGYARQTNGLDDTREQLIMIDNPVSHCKNFGQMVLIRVLITVGCNRINRQGIDE